MYKIYVALLLEVFKSNESCFENASFMCLLFRVVWRIPGDLFVVVCYTKVCEKLGLRANNC
jgi:hypothetical protein